MRHSVRARFLLTLVCAMSVLAPVATAAASNGSPVHVDPSSPVAKEYALPLATARGAPPESGRNGTLFGSGIKHSPRRSVTTEHTTTTPTPAAQTEQAPPAPTEPAPPVTTAPVTTPPVTSPTATETTSTPTATTPKHQRPRDITTVTLPDLLTAPTGNGTPPNTASAAPAAYTVLKPGSGSGVLWMVLAAVIVVAVGSAAGIALSRRR